MLLHCDLSTSTHASIKKVRSTICCCNTVILTLHMCYADTQFNPLLCVMCVNCVLCVWGVHSRGEERGEERKEERKEERRGKRRGEERPYPRPSLSYPSSSISLLNGSPIFSSFFISSSFSFFISSFSSLFFFSSYLSLFFFSSYLSLSLFLFSLTVTNRLRCGTGVLEIPPQAALKSLGADTSSSHVDIVLMEKVSAAVLQSLTRQLDMECRALSDTEADTYMQHVTSTYGVRSLQMAGES